MRQLFYLSIVFSTIFQNKGWSFEILNESSMGVSFEHNLSWDEVKAKARAENKYIFMDCYATWCGPCKIMDRDVYTNDSVSHFMNDKFISVKVQMDKTQFDDSNVIKWYSDAIKIDSTFSIMAYPTFLFFDSESKPVHRAVGSKSPSEFVSLASNALNPEKQYFRILSIFESRKLDTAKMKNLARDFRTSGGDLASNIATDYLQRIAPAELSDPDNIKLMDEFKQSPLMQKIAVKYILGIKKNDYLSTDVLSLIDAFHQDPEVQDAVIRYLADLDQTHIREDQNLRLLKMLSDNLKVREIENKYFEQLSQNDLYSQVNIDFLSKFANSSKDKAFSFFYLHGGKVDTIMKQMGYSKNILNNIIINEEIKPFWDATKDSEVEPDWNAIYHIIQNKYDDTYAQRNVLFCRERFYEYRAKKYDKDWNKYIKYNIQLFKKIDPTVVNDLKDLSLNNFIYTAIFFHSSLKSEINWALRSMLAVLNRHKNERIYSAYCDTYANLIYKNRDVKAALFWEDNALQNARLNKNEFGIHKYEAIFIKMQTGVPTWTIPK